MDKPEPFSIDVVIPTFNETHKLLQAVKSVLAQSVRIGAIVVVDDGSDEAVVHFLEKEVATIPGVTLLKLPHSGHPGVARKAGINATSAEWVAFLDADDVWLETKVAQQADLVKESRYDLLFANAWRVEGSHSTIFFPQSGFMPNPNLKILLRDNLIINSSVLVRRSALESIGLYASSKLSKGAEDFATWLRLATLYKFCGTSIPLLMYCVQESSFSTRSSPSAKINAIIDWLVWLIRANIQAKKKLQSFFLGSLFLVRESMLLFWISTYKKVSRQN